MFISEILWATRNDYLDDTEIPYLWSDDELLRALNRIYPEFVRETGIIRDVSTTAITRSPILSGSHTYAMDSRITEIHSPVSGITYDPTNDVYTELLIDVKDDYWVDENIPYWRTETGDVVCIIPDYGSGYFRIVRYPDPETTGYWSGAFTFVSGTKTISQSGALFSTYLVAGNEVVISGTVSNGTTAVPKTFTVVTVAADSFTVSETVTDEVLASGGIIQKVIMTINMTVNRLGLQAFTIGDIATQYPEIRSEFHPYLIDGILKEAYLKQDSECLDKEKATVHRRIFEENKQKARQAKEAQRYFGQRVKPHPGAL